MLFKSIFLTICLSLAISSDAKPTNTLIEIGTIGSKTFYEVFEQEKVTWVEAKDLCASQNLAFGMTENNAEFNFVYENRVGKDFWIAATQKGVVSSSGDVTFEAIDSFSTLTGGDVEKEINFFQFPTQALCAYASGDHHTYVDSCVVAKHNTLCESVA